MLLQKMQTNKIGSILCGTVVFLFLIRFTFYHSRQHIVREFLTYIIAKYVQKCLYVSGINTIAEEYFGVFGQPTYILFIHNPWPLFDLCRIREY